MLTLRVASPLPLAAPLVEIEIDLAATTLEWTTQLPGGYGRLAVGLPAAGAGRPWPGYLPRPLGTVAGREHVEVWAGGACVYQGQLVEVTRVDGVPRGLLAEGYGGVGLAERVVRATDPLVVSGGTLVEAALALLPHIAIDRDRWQDPGGAYRLSDVDGQTVADVVQRVARAGDGSGRIWDWAVWEGPRLTLQPRVAPDTPDWVVDRAGVEERISYADLASRVQVAYAGGETDAAVAGDLEARLGRPIELRVDGGQLSADEADRVRTAWLSRYRGARAAVTIDGAALRSPRGERPLPWQVRAGQWVEVYGTPYLVTQTQYEADRDRLTVQLGEAEADWLDAWQRVDRAVADLARGVNPATGAPQLVTSTPATTPTGGGETILVATSPPESVALPYVATRPTADLTLTTTPQTVPGTTLTLPAGGTYLVTAVVRFDISTADQYGLAKIVHNGSDVSGWAYFRAASSARVEATVTQAWVRVAQAGDTLELQAWKDAGTGTSYVRASDTQLWAVRLRP